MSKHGNKHQVNLHSQKIAKISLKTFAFSVNRSVTFTLTSQNNKIVYRVNRNRLQY
jgi:hypothetical protein